MLARPVTGQLRAARRLGAVGASVALVGAACWTPVASARAAATTGEASHRGAAAGPRLYVYVTVFYRSRIESTVRPSRQHRVRTWSSEYALVLSFGFDSTAMGRALHPSDLLRALSRPASLRVSGEFRETSSVIGRYRETTTEGSCGGRIYATGTPVLKAEASRGATLFLAVDFGDDKSVANDPPPCSHAPAGILQGDPGLLGTCNSVPTDLPLKLFTNLLAECITRSHTLYFTIDVDRPAPSVTSASFHYAYNPLGARHQRGHFAVTVTWNARASVEA